jgi:hypothetical protein
MPEIGGDWMKTLIDRIEEAMRSDDADREKQSDYLAGYYGEADDEEKRLIDLCFIALCGWSLNRFLQR